MTWGCGELDPAKFSSHLRLLFFQASSEKGGRLSFRHTHLQSGKICCLGLQSAHARHRFGRWGCRQHVAKHAEHQPWRDTSVSKLRPNPSACFSLPPHTKATQQPVGNGACSSVGGGLRFRRLVFEQEGLSAAILARCRHGKRVSGESTILSGSNLQKNKQSVIHWHCFGRERWGQPDRTLIQN